MQKLLIHLKSINDVKEYVNIVNSYDFGINLISGRYNVDSKSIMSILSLDLSNPITVVINSDDCVELLDRLSVYAVKK